MTRNPDFDALLFEQDGGLVTLTLNRPDAANAVNLPLAQELTAAAIRCDEDTSVRAVVLTGAGAMFCAGGDLNAMAERGDDVSAFIKELTTYLHAAISRFARMRAPLIVAVNGTAAGAGMSLAAIGDIVLASDGAVFTMAYTAAGLAPDGSSSYFLPRVVGLRRAQELMLTNRRLSAAEAADWGLVTHVVPAADLSAEANKLGSRLAAGPTHAYGEVKKLLTTSFSETLETQMEFETRAIAAMAGTADGREGIAAFLEKRKPDFTGT